MHIVVQVRNVDFLAAATHGAFKAHGLTITRTVLYAEDTRPV